MFEKYRPFALDFAPPQRPLQLLILIAFTAVTQRAVSACDSTTGGAQPAEPDILQVLDVLEVLDVLDVLGSDISFVASREKPDDTTWYRYFAKVK